MTEIWNTYTINATYILHSHIIKYGFNTDENVSCNFEDPHLCGYIVELNKRSDFNWLYMNASTELHYQDGKKQGNFHINGNVYYNTYLRPNLFKVDVTTDIGII